MTQYLTKDTVRDLERKIGKRSVAMRRWYNFATSNNFDASNQPVLTGGGQRKRALNVLEQTHVKIAPSNVGGVGVTAIRSIKQGTDPFPNTGSDRPYVMLSYEEISHLHEKIRGMIQDFHLVTGKTYDFSKPMDFRPQDKFPVPVDGLNNMNVSWFLNHDGHNPNVGVDPAQTGGLWSRFVTLRDVHEGEELRYNYNV
jgi:hypothetical protein